MGDHHRHRCTDSDYRSGLYLQASALLREGLRNEYRASADDRNHKHRANECQVSGGPQIPSGSPSTRARPIATAPVNAVRTYRPVSTAQHGPTMSSPIRMM
jgi:hypothetical protein